MKRLAAKRIAWVLLAVFLVLTAVATVTRSDALFNVAIVTLVAMAVVELAFNRCPHCGAYVGRAGGKYCSQCGQSLEDEP